MKNFNFSSSLPGPNASLTVMAYMFEESGNITFGNETSEMRKGMLKFNIQVSCKSQKIHLHFKDGENPR